MKRRCGTTNRQRTTSPSPHSLSSHPNPPPTALPIMRVYFYQPLPRHVDQNWRTAEDALAHLITHPHERQRIMDDICAIEPGQPYIVRIHHWCLPSYITYSTVDPDREFLRRLEGFLNSVRGSWHTVFRSPSVSPACHLLYPQISISATSVIRRQNSIGDDHSKGSPRMSHMR